MEHKNTSRRAMIHVNHKYLGKVDHLSTNPRSTYREYVTTFWWKSFPENDLPKIGSSLWFQRVMFEAFALSLSLFSLYSPWLRAHVHSFLGFWRPTDPHAAEDTMDCKSYSTLPAAKESMDLVPTLAKNPFQHDGMISGHEEAKKTIWKKDEKGAHGWTGPWLLLKVPSLFNKPNIYNCSTSIRFLSDKVSLDSIKSRNKVRESIFAEDV